MTGSGMSSTIVAQFRRPTGWQGRVAGWIMAHRPSNLERNRRTLCLLEVAPTDRVLEIGFGPGVALGWAAEQATRGHVVGIDHSPEMVREAGRRNADLVGKGRIELHEGDVESLLGGGQMFDKAFAVNVAMFWPDPVSTLATIRTLLRPGGRLALTFQPRMKGATSLKALAGADRMAQQARDAGFENVGVEVLRMKPVDAVCVLATTPMGRSM